ncbi:putative reverse transcriptase domain-containing protein [Tanacetum coccineum]
MGVLTNEFLACKPRDFDGKGGAIPLTMWIEKMELVMDISGCVNYEKVKNNLRRFQGIACEGVLSRLVPHLVTPESKCIDRYIHGLVPQIREMIRATQPTTIQSTILKAGALTNERAMVGKGFVATGTTRNEYVGSHPKCVKCNAHHPESRPCRLCYNCQKPSHITRDCQSAGRQVASINAVRMKNSQRAYYKCGSTYHLRNICSKLNRAPGQVGNRFTIEGNQNPRNNENQARGRAFNVNAIEARQDPNVVTGVFSLNNHYATVLFDSEANISFISTKFMSLLNVKPSILRPSYVIEVANDKKMKTDRIIRHFDVIVGMDWISKHKAKIVYHEKVVWIPFATGEAQIRHIFLDEYGVLGVRTVSSNVFV